MTLLDTAKTFEVVPGSDRDVEEFASRASRARRLFITLLNAEVSFCTGKADFTNAITNLGNLFSARDEAEEMSKKELGQIDAFFNPPEVSKYLKDMDEMANFVAEAIPHLRRSDG